MNLNRLILLQNKTVLHIFFDIECQFRVIICKLAVTLVLCDVIFTAEKRPDTSQLQND